MKKWLTPKNSSGWSSQTVRACITIPSVKMTLPMTCASGIAFDARNVWHGVNGTVANVINVRTKCFSSELKRVHSV